LKKFPKNRSRIPYPPLPKSPKDHLRPQLHYTPNPGIFQPPIAGKPQFGLRLSTNDPLFDRKVLEYLLIHRVGQYLLTTGFRAGTDLSQSKKIHFSGLISGSDFPVPSHFSGPEQGRCPRSEKMTFKTVILYPPQKWGKPTLRCLCLSNA